MVNLQFTVPVKPLSSREEEVVSLASEGLTDKEIASHLDLAVGTILSYWVRIRNKYEGRARAEIVSNYFKSVLQKQLNSGGKKYADRATGLSQDAAATVLNIVPDALAIVDSGLYCVYANESLGRLVGKKRIACVGKKLTELGLPAELASSLVTAVKKCLKSRRQGQVEGQPGRQYSASVLPCPDLPGIKSPILVDIRS